jgi:PfaD family protein
VGLNGVLCGQPPSPYAYPVLGILPALYPEWLGDREFLAAHRLRFPLVVGEMATGIASEAVVMAAARMGCLGFFGAGGLSLERVEKALATLSSELNPQGLSWGINLIHSPHDPSMEDKLVDLYLRYAVERVSASAFMSLSPSIVRYSASGLEQDANGNIVRRHHVIAKLSRSEVAMHFLSPAPAEMLKQLRADGKISALQAELAARVPVAEDITVEADSGGHTDNRPLVSMIPVAMTLRDSLAAKYGYKHPVRIGAAGGMGSPASVAAAFSLGAAYVMTGSVNQSAIESGTSDLARQMLAQAQITDVAMAPAADMFELGVRVQVLKRGTLFASRGTTLYEVYTKHESWEEVPAALARQVQDSILRASFEEIWQQCETFWSKRDAAQVVRAEKDPKHKMALVFRWYLGNSTVWARNGVADRRLDFQIWCGPAMGAFNDWVKGSFLAEPENRTIAQIGLNLLEGAACIARAQQLRAYGLPLAGNDFDFRPRPLS